MAAKGTVIEEASWDEIEERDFGTFPVLEAGVYSAYLKDWKSKIAGPKSKNPGSTYYNLQWVVESEDDDDVSVFQPLYTTPKSVGATKFVLRVLGANFTGRTVDDIEDMLEEVKGNQARIRVRVRDYQSSEVDEEGEFIVKQTNEVRNVLVPQ